MKSAFRISATAAICSTLLMLPSMSFAADQPPISFAPPPVSNIDMSTLTERKGGFEVAYGNVTVDVPGMSLTGNTYGLSITEANPDGNSSRGTMYFNDITSSNGKFSGDGLGFSYAWENRSKDGFAMGFGLKYEIMFFEIPNGAVNVYSSGFYLSTLYLDQTTMGGFISVQKRIPLGHKMGFTPWATFTAQNTTIAFDGGTANIPEQTSSASFPTFGFDFDFDRLSLSALQQKSGDVKTTAMTLKWTF